MKKDFNRRGIPPPLVRLADQLHSLPGQKLAVAFSGGLDSRFLCFMAKRLGLSVLALHATGPHIMDHESVGGRRFAEKYGIPFVAFHFNPLALSDVAKTTRERCYACKTALIRRMRERLDAMGEQSISLADGSNLDDLSHYRPGLHALREKGILSPLAEAGIPKKLIRSEAIRAGMNMPEEASRPCLLTRYAYGLAPTTAGLERLARAEQRLAKLKNDDGCPALADFRLRLTPEPILQTTPSSSCWMPQVKKILAEEGFAEAAIRMDDIISGFFDRKNAE